MAIPKDAKFLKNMATGRVFVSNPYMAQRDDMLPCDANGKLLGADDKTIEAATPQAERRKSKYLGCTKTGNIFGYNKYLAERADMISVDSYEEWDNWRKQSEALPAVAEEGAAPPLSRATQEPAAKTSEDVTNEPDYTPEPVEVFMPNVDGMGKREAKTVLANWAKLNFATVIDRSKGLDVVIAECGVLLETPPPSAATG